MGTTRTIVTRHDARNRKRRSSSARRADRQARVTPPDNLHPGIGMLVTAAGLKFYAHLGPHRTYCEGDVETLTWLLLHES
jgi:hypothetical protein